MQVSSTLLPDKRINDAAVLSHYPVAGVWVRQTGQSHSFLQNVAAQNTEKKDVAQRLYTTCFSLP